MQPPNVSIYILQNDDPRRKAVLAALSITEDLTEINRHVANILSKLGFSSRTQVAAWVVDKGLDK